MAVRFGIAPDLLEAVGRDIATAPSFIKRRPIMDYVAKLALDPTKLVADGANAVYIAAWDDRALHDAVAVCALFNFMNRYVAGLGIEADTGYAEISARRLHAQRYAALLDRDERASLVEHTIAFDSP